MASKGPILGYVDCVAPGCASQMRVRQSKRGRGGYTAKYGACEGCGKLLQGKAHQDYLSQYRAAGEEPPELAPEAAPVVESVPAAVEDWHPGIDPLETPVETPAKPGKPRRRDASSGGAGRLILGGLAIVAVAIGAGALVKQ